MIITDAAATVFLLPPAALVALVVLYCLGIVGVVGLLLLRVFDLPAKRAPQAPFHVAITGVFALMLSFAASDAWKRGDAAYGALLREVSEVEGLLQVADSVQGMPGEAVGAGRLREMVKAYLTLSLRDEWGRRNLRSSDAVEGVVQQARGLALERLAATGNPVWRVAYDRVEGLHAARTVRLVAGGLFGDMLRWGGLMALFIAGAVAIGLVHLDRRGAVWGAFWLYAAAGSIALSMVAVTEHPYAGWDATEPDRLVAILGRL